jgi:hypothetical protein
MPELLRIALREAVTVEIFDHDPELPGPRHYPACRPIDRRVSVRWTIGGEEVTDADTIRRYETIYQERKHAAPQPRP